MVGTFCRRLTLEQPQLDRTHVVVLLLCLLSYQVPEHLWRTKSCLLSKPFVLLDPDVSDPQNKHINETEGGGWGCLALTRSSQSLRKHKLDIFIISWSQSKALPLLQKCKHQWWESSRKSRRLMMFGVVDLCQSCFWSRALFASHPRRANRTVKAPEGETLPVTGVQD